MNPAVTDPLHIQALLRAGSSPEAIASEFGLEAPKRHHEFPNLVQFKYDQLAMKKDDPLPLQCRGLILDEANDWACVARPFDKFWNLEEPQAAAIDWQTARVMEKLDGSLMILYYYAEPGLPFGNWLVATSGRPDASGNVNGQATTFEELFWKTFYDLDMEFPSQRNFGHLTFMFELTSPYNRIVVDNGAKPKLRLIGVRDRNTGREFTPGPFLHAFPQWKCVREFYIPHPDPDVRGRGPDWSPEALKNSFETMDPMKQEGYVVVDENFQRVKVKHPGYVVAHQLRGSWSVRVALDVVRKGESQELAAHFPEMKAQLHDYQQRLYDLEDELQRLYDGISGIESQKAFALHAVQSPLGGAPLFAMRSGRVKSIAHFLAEMNIDRLIEALGL